MQNELLIVDDEKYLLDIYTKYLRVNGYTIFEATSSVQALNILKNKEINGIISDMKVDNMNGIDIIESAKKIHPDIFSILITAYPEINTSKECKKHGIDIFLEKPFSMDELCDAIEIAKEKRKIKNRTFIDKIELLNMLKEISKRHLTGHFLFKTGGDKLVFEIFVKNGKFIHGLSPFQKGINALKQLICLNVLLHVNINKLPYDFDTSYAPDISELISVDPICELAKDLESIILNENDYPSPTINKINTLLSHEELYLMKKLDGTSSVKEIQEKLGKEQIKVLKSLYKKNVIAFHSLPYKNIVIYNTDNYLNLKIKSSLYNNPVNIIESNNIDDLIHTLNTRNVSIVLLNISKHDLRQFSKLYNNFPTTTWFFITRSILDRFIISLKKGIKYININKIDKKIWNYLS